MNDGIDEWMSGQRGKGRDIHKSRLHTRQRKGQKGERPCPFIVSVNLLTLRATYCKKFRQILFVSNQNLEINGKFLIVAASVLYLSLYLFHSLYFAFLFSFLDSSVLSFIVFLFGATAPNGSRPPHSRRF
jgi:hypothetical protein